MSNEQLFALRMLIANIEHLSSRVNVLAPEDVRAKFNYKGKKHVVSLCVCVCVCVCVCACDGDRKRDGESVCVHVLIRTYAYSLSLIP